jgi:AcrR family transcriptional regulator
MADTSTFMKLREDERAVRKRLIMQAAMKLFEEKLFHEIGMREIASEAGVSAATIYRYFPSRDDLFIEALIQDINNIEKLLKEQLARGRNRIEDLAIATVDYLVNNEATFQMMCHFMIGGGINPKAMNKFNAVQVYFMNMFDGIVKKIEGSENMRLFTEAFFASITGVVMTFRNYPGRSKEDKRKHMHQLALLIMRDDTTLKSLE